VAAVALPADQRPDPGPIAVLPEARAVFVDAVRAGGGEVAPLSADTRGLIWLAPHGVAEFAGVLESNQQLSWVQLPWAGIDSLAEVVREHERPGLLWTSGKGAYAQPVAEHALMLTLALLREVPKRLAARSWNPVSSGTSLYGRNVVIVGAGGIAIELLRLIEPFGTSTAVVRRGDQPVRGASRTVPAERLDELLPEADVVVIAAALTPETYRLFDASRLALLKPSAVLVNVARGALVDTDALLVALNADAIAGAGIDVTDPEPLPDGHPLWDAPNLIITPHTADTPEMTAPLLAARVRHNVEAFLGRGDFAGIVDPAAGY
jgi:phosphoglycerate dehydrogenase-like enzyme